jgi:hypothetical protein
MPNTLLQREIILLTKEKHFLYIKQTNLAQLALRQISIFDIFTTFDFFFQNLKTFIF